MATTTAPSIPATTTEDDRPKLLLIDGHSVAYRAFFALPVQNFSTSTGQATNAVFGFTSMLINLLRDWQPTHLGVAFDVSRHSFRTEAYEDYKATRNASPTEFRGQVELIKEVLDAMRVPHLEKDGFEADDLLATLATRAERDGMDVRVCTGDRDSFQLVTDRVHVLYPRKGVSDLLDLDPAGVEEKYLVTPGRYPELAALVGESSDNLPGVPGVGPKTAAKWLSQYDGLENLLARVTEVKGKAGDNLRDHLADVRRNRDLNRLIRDVEIDVTPADLERHAVDREAVHQLFDQLEFRVLRDRLFDLLPAEDAAAADRPATLDVADDTPAAGTLGDWLAAHTADGPSGLDVTGRWSAGTGDIVSLSVAGADGHAVTVDPTELSPQDERALADWFADPARHKVIHDGKGPLLACWARGWAPEGLWSDTALAAYLLRPDQRTYDLADLVSRSLHTELVVDEAGQAPAQLALDLGDETDSAGHQARIRAEAVRRLAGALEEDLDSHQATGLLHDVELPLMRVLAGMERTGVALDTGLLDGLHGDFDARVRRAADEAYEVLGHEVNLGSPKQLQAVLFDDLKMPKTRRTRTGYTTDAEALQTLYEQTDHPFLAHLLEHRDAIRLRQTVEGLQKAVADDGRIHTTFLQTVAATGRLSSTDPNLQNIPVRTEEGRRIREAFVVGDGYDCLLTADYSQIEMRIMAHVSGDDALIEAFRSGRDFHAVTASHVFGVPADEVTGAQRAKIKAMNYGLAYGLSAFGLSNQLRVPVAEAKELMADYFAIFGEVHQYLTGVVDEARRSGYTATLLGRRRYLPDLTSSNRQRREMAERMALNAPIQGSAADIIKLAMLRVDARLREAGLASRMLLQIHDELMFEVAPGEQDRVEALVREAMGSAMDLAVPLDVSVGSGRSWHEAAH
ncbi:DNA polymerase I [Raineyella sp. LH-20]|uniref:DNA polymerase I n=1 Tax=Raineyella sp. LH-20 TaxID=3081204 RepID=UPI002952B906|nr:DNA polymerase I [Raineyella sp. LH-20]WOP17661.1 DNA polymerase I [Raineyella sp. LH-20]